MLVNSELRVLCLLANLSNLNRVLLSISEIIMIMVVRHVNTIQDNIFQVTNESGSERRAMSVCGIR